MTVLRVVLWALCLWSFLSLGIGMYVEGVAALFGGRHSILPGAIGAAVAALMLFLPMIVLALDEMGPRPKGGK